MEKYYTFQVTHNNMPLVLKVKIFWLILKKRTISSPAFPHTENATPWRGLFSVVLAVCFFLFPPYFYKICLCCSSLVFCFIHDRPTLCCWRTGLSSFTPPASPLLLLSCHYNYITFWVKWIFSICISVVT